jgi:hypothetical protein
MVYVSWPTACRPEAGLLAVLFVADLLHPVSVLAVERLGDGDMGHRRRRRRSMPMLKPWRKPDDIAGPELLDGAALALSPAEPRRDDEGLAKRMRVPRVARARFERNVTSTYTSRLRRLEEGIHADRAREPFCGSLEGGL